MENTIFALRGSPTDVVEKFSDRQVSGSANPLQCLTENEALLDRQDRSNSPRNVDIKTKRTLDELNSSPISNSTSSNEKSGLKRSIDRCNSDTSLNMSWSPQHKCERSGDSNNSINGKEPSSVFDSHMQDLLHDTTSGVSPINVETGSEKDNTIESPVVMENKNLFTSFDNSTSLSLDNDNNDDKEEASLEQGEAGEGEQEQEQEQEEQGEEEEQEEEEESEDAKVARELAESEALAWQMMQEESQHAYDMQMQYMQDHANNMSAEDYAAMQMAMNEGNAQPAVAMPGNSQRRRNRRANSQSTDGSGDGNGDAETLEDDGEGEDGEEEEASDGSEEESVDEDEAWQDPNNYEHLLALSSQIGDVKTERWRLKAPGVIAALPRVTYAQILATSKEGDSSKSHDSSSGKTDSVEGEGEEEGGEEEQEAIGSEENGKMCLSLTALKNRLVGREIDAKCAVCMGEFCCSEGHGDDEEELVLLPCDHYFHAECVEGWMKDNNSCPHCLQEVAP